MAAKAPAPYCIHTMGGGLHCYRRTRHESGLCAQHRPGLNGRGQPPISARPAHIITCKVDESGGMAEIAAAEALLAAAYGPGEWVRDEPADQAPLIECPHWAPGRVTQRKGCTACEADPRAS